MYNSHSKCYTPHPESKAIPEHFSSGNSLPLTKLEKIIQISILISVQVRPIQR